MGNSDRPFEVTLDSRVNVSQADLQKQFDLLIQVRDELDGFMQP